MIVRLRSGLVCVFLTTELLLCLINLDVCPANWTWSQAWFMTCCRANIPAECRVLTAKVNYYSIVVCAFVIGNAERNNVRQMRARLLETRSHSLLTVYICILYSYYCLRRLYDFLFARFLLCIAFSYDSRSMWRWTLALFDFAIDHSLVQHT